MNYKLTDHVKQRYAERIIDKTNKTDIIAYVAENQNKIYQDIEKMVDYGVVLYTGASAVDYNKSLVQVILNGHWVVIVDPKQEKVVTLFEIDLGLGKEFNDEYINRLLEKLNAAKEKCEEKIKEIEQNVVDFNGIIDENEVKIREYKTFIKSLEQQNSNMAAIITEAKHNKLIAEQEVRDIIAIFCGKKVF